MKKNEAEAVLALTKEINERTGRVNVIYDERIKEMIIYKKKSLIPVLDSVCVESAGVVSDDDDESLNNGEYTKIISRLHKNVLKVAKKYPSANYMFVSNYKTNVACDDYSIYLYASCIVHPVAAIGEEEIECLKEIYRGHPPEDAKKLADVLGIDISVDYPELWKASPETFKGYFSQISRDAQEEELNKMLPLIKSDESLQEWLSKTVPDLAERTAKKIYMIKRQPKQGKNPF